MCGIVGCVGHEGATGFVAEGLRSLEFRGYDSAGMAFPEIGSSGLHIVKSLGVVANAEAQLAQEGLEPQAMAATTAIGHTRWATHGGKSRENAHPHTNSSHDIAVVHNGKIYNHREIREELSAEGVTFRSETDTEVVPHLISRFYKDGASPEEAIEKSLARIVGEYALLIQFGDIPDTLYAAKLGSPLVLGVNGHEHFAASAVVAFGNHTKKIVPLEDYELARISADGGYETWNYRSKRTTTRTPEDIGAMNEVARLGEYPHWMIKEIYDSPETVRNALQGRVHPETNLVKLGGLEENPEIQEHLRHTDRLLIVACGTSYHAGLIGRRLIEDITGLPVDVELASELKFDNVPLSPNTVVVGISQSGETADTIAALKKAQDHGLLTLGINNSPGSAIDRMTVAGVHCSAGQEISVASTKAFTSQVTVLSELALALTKMRGKSSELFRPVLQELDSLPDKIEQLLANTSTIESVAQKYANVKNFLYIGRGYNLPGALEGALKLKETAYINAQGIGAGEMKHGTLALIDKDFPSFVIATDSPSYDQTLSSISELTGRDGPVIALACEGNEEITELADDVLYVPKTIEQLQPILNGVVMQLFAYYVTTAKGLNPDRPRNLAKSVTVE